VSGAADCVRAALTDSGLEFEEVTAGSFVAVLPGERKQRTTVSLVVGEHAMTVNAFVARRPDENHMAVYRWLLERNRRTYGVAYALDHLGDIYLVGRISLDAVTRDEVDRILGSVLENADGSFNTLLEMGFPTAIRREWQWRTDRGESLANLEAFRRLVEGDPDAGDARPASGA
jgi:hypothetical protein